MLWASAVIVQHRIGSTEVDFADYAGVVDEEETPAVYPAAESFFQFRIQLDNSTAPSIDLKPIFARGQLARPESAVRVGRPDPCDLAQ